MLVTLKIEIYPVGCILCVSPACVKFDRVFVGKKTNLFLTDTSTVDTYFVVGKASEVDYKALYEVEKANHCDTSEKLLLSVARLDEKEKQILATEKRHKEELKSLEKQVREIMGL